MRETMDVIFLAVPSSSLLAVRNPAGGEQRADVVETDEPIARFGVLVLVFQHLDAKRGKRGGLLAGQAHACFQRTMLVSESVTGDAYMM